MAQTSLGLSCMGNEMMLKNNIDKLAVDPWNWHWDSHEHWNQRWDNYVRTQSPDSKCTIKKQRATPALSQIFFSEKPHPTERRPVWPWTYSKEGGAILKPLPAASQEPRKKAVQGILCCKQSAPWGWYSFWYSLGPMSNIRVGHNADILVIFSCPPQHPTLPWALPGYPLLSTSSAPLSSGF